MSEWEPINQQWVNSSHLVDEIWVPSYWHKDMFAASGVLLFCRSAYSVRFQLANYKLYQSLLTQIFGIQKSRFR